MYRIFWRALRLPAAALYLAAVSWTPVAHAQTEVVSSDPAVEAGHSGECEVLHIDGACVVTGVAKMRAPASEAQAPIGDALRLRFVQVQGIHVSASELSPVSERGPPTPSN